MKGKLITFEGIDGSGKTTQIKLLEKKLKQQKIAYVILREPGGTKLSEKIRELLLNHENIEISSLTESLLFLSARAQIVIEKIKPALKIGEFVICDRFIDSTVAYQGYGRGLKIAYLDKLNMIATDGIQPDITFILDIHPTEAVHRIGIDRGDRMESMGQEFFSKVREGYYQIAERFPNRCIIINAKQPIRDVFRLVSKHIDEKLFKEIICS